LEASGGGSSRQWEDATGVGDIEEPVVFGGHANAFHQVVERLALMERKFFHFVDFLLVFEALLDVDHLLVVVALVEVVLEVLLEPLLPVQPVPPRLRRRRRQRARPPIVIIGADGGRPMEGSDHTLLVGEVLGG